MEIRRKYNNIIPKIFKVGAIVLYPYMLFRAPQEDFDRIYNNEKLYKHEWIHVEQVRRMGWFKFYFLYLVDSIILLRGYKKNRYEIEAYDRQSEPFTDEEQKAYNEDFGS